MITVAVVLALAVVGTGAAFAYRTYVGSPRSGEPPIIKADNSPTKIVPAPSDGTRQGAGPHGDRRRRREDRSARGSPGRRQCQVRSARGVSAAEPEQQSAVGRERRARRPAACRRRQWHAAERTSRARSRRLPSAAIRPMEPRCRSTRRRRPNPPPRRSAAAARPAAPHAKSAIIGQCQRQCAAVADAAGRSAGSGARGPGLPPPIPCRPRPAAAGDTGPGRLAEERGRRAGLLPGAAGQVFRPCSDRARR